MKKAKTEKENLVSHLTGLLPVDIISVIAREPENKVEKYDFIKKNPI